MTRLTVLSVAYPLAPTGPDAVGGAEQILTQMDAALVRAGHHSLVVACEGSQTHGTLIPTPCPPPGTPLDDRVKAWVQRQHQCRIAEAIEDHDVDLIHFHGIDFHSYLPPSGIPTLVTLHLPPDWYPPEIWRLPRPFTYLHPVSWSQHRACPPDAANLLPPIENGVPVDELGAHRHARRDFAFTLGRICPEKNFHVALDAGKRAGVPVLLAGEVFPYETHQRYFDEQIVPRLDARNRFVGPVGFARKRRLMASARCLLLPTLAAETSSLVVREALACGTPVVAFPSGAIPEAVEHGKTGFLVNSMEEMADAIAACDGIDRDYCREVARRRFSLRRMTDAYLAAYEHILRDSAGLPSLRPGMEPLWDGDDEAAEELTYAARR